MAKATVRDAILLNVVAAVLLAIAAAVWGASALVKSNAVGALEPLPQSPAETLYKVGRYDLLRDTAVNCERTFAQLAGTSLNGQISADWTTAILALLAMGVLIFNIWFLRAVRQSGGNVAL
jgi:hypothetical protein